jgi:hypothetical protein
MEISQGNSLCSYLYQKQAKCHFFLFFFFYKQEGGTGPSQSGYTSRRDEFARKRDRRVNTVQKTCIYVCKCKNDNF